MEWEASKIFAPIIVKSRFKGCWRLGFPILTKCYNILALSSNYIKPFAAETLSAAL